MSFAEVVPYKPVSTGGIKSTDSVSKESPGKI